MDSNLKKLNTAWSPFIDLCVVYCFLCGMGFPGTLSILIGDLPAQLLRYAALGLELFLVIFTSADDLMDIKLLDLKGKYAVVYLYLIYICVQSMVVTCSRSRQTMLCVQLLFNGFFALWVADRYTVEEILDYMLAAQSIYVFISLVLYFGLRRVGFYYDEAGLYLFRGLADRKNGVGEELSFFISLQIARLLILHRSGKKPGSFALLLLLLQFFLLIMTSAMGAMFVLSAAAFFLLFMEKRLGVGGRIQWGLMFVVVTVSFLVFATTILSFFSPILEYFGKDATLSNRTTIWEGVIATMQEHRTMTGSGFGMFWEDAESLAILHGRFPRDSWYSSMTFGTHNAVLELWVDTGLIGVAAFFIMLIYSYRNVKLLSETQYLFCSAIMVVQTIRGLTERSYSVNGYTTVFLIIGLGVASNVELHRDRPRAAVGNSKTMQGE